MRFGILPRLESTVASLSEAVAEAAGWSRSTLLDLLVGLAKFEARRDELTHPAHAAKFATSDGTAAFAVGEAVELHGLSASECNGARGTVRSAVSEAGRLEVCMPSVRCPILSRSAVKCDLLVCVCARLTVARP